MFGDCDDEVLYLFRDIPFIEKRVNDYLQRDSMYGNVYSSYMGGIFDKGRFMTYLPVYITLFNELYS